MSDLLRMCLVSAVAATLVGAVFHTTLETDVRHSLPGVLLAVHRRFCSLHVKRCIRRAGFLSVAMLGLHIQHYAHGVLAARRRRSRSTNGQGSCSSRTRNLSGRRSP